jgi:hypothetical protein
LNILKVQLKGLRATNQKLLMIYLPKERAPMPITKARLDRMIDMIDSAWLKRRDSENTNPKQFLSHPVCAIRQSLSRPVLPFTAMARHNGYMVGLQRKIYLANNGERKCQKSTPTVITD